MFVLARLWYFHRGRVTPLVGFGPKILRTVGQFVIGHRIACVTDFTSQDRHQRAAAHVRPIVDSFSFTPHRLKEFILFRLMHLNFIAGELPWPFALDLMSDQIRGAFGTIDIVFNVVHASGNLACVGMGFCTVRPFIHD